MLSQDQPSEITLLENQLKLITEKFDQAVKKDMVLGDVKELFHELKIISTRLDSLKEHPIKKEAQKAQIILSLDRITHLAIQYRSDTIVTESELNRCINQFLSFLLSAFRSAFRVCI